MSLDQVRELISVYGDQLALVVNHSAGKDSSRMLGYLEENFPTQPIYVVMADTGFEHSKPATAEDFARENCARYGLPLYVTKACWGSRHKENGAWVKNPPELIGTRKTYLQMVEKRGMFPGTDTRQCTADLKRGPIYRFINSIKKNHDYKVIVNCTGIRAAESPNRAKMAPWKRNDDISTKKVQVWDWMPIFTESLQDVLRWHHANGVRLHPVYIPAYHADGTTGGYLRRLSCRLCIFSTDADIRAIYEHDREAFDVVSDLEQRINFTMKNGKSLLQIIQATPADTAQYGSEEDHPSLDLAEEEALQPCLF